MSCLERFLFQRLFPRDVVKQSRNTGLVNKKNTSRSDIHRYDQLKRKNIVLAIKINVLFRKVINGYFLAPNQVVSLKNVSYS